MDGALADFSSYEFVQFLMHLSMLVPRGGGIRDGVGTLIDISRPGWGSLTKLEKWINIHQSPFPELGLKHERWGKSAQSFFFIDHQPLSSRNVSHTMTYSAYSISLFSVPTVGNFELEILPKGREVWRKICASDQSPHPIPYPPRD